MRERKRGGRLDGARERVASTQPWSQRGRRDKRSKTLQQPTPWSRNHHFHCYQQPPQMSFDEDADARATAAIYSDILAKPSAKTLLLSKLVRQAHTCSSLPLL